MDRFLKLGKNIGLMTIGNFASKLLTFLFIPLYTHILSTEEYGIADILSTTITLLMPLITLQISEAILRFSLDKNADQKQIFTSSCCVLALGFVVFLCLSPVLFLFEKVASLYLLFVLYYISTVLYTFLSQFAKGIERVKAYSISGIINTIIVVTCNIIFLVVLRTGVKGYISSFVIGQLVASAFLAISIRVSKYIIPIKSVDWKLLKQMLHYSVPMIPNSFCWWVTNSSDKYMVTYFISVAANGIYSIAYKIPSLLSTISTIFMSAWHISAVEDFGTKESTAFFKVTYRKISEINQVVVSLLILLAKPIAYFLYANDFFSAWRIAIVLNLAFLFHMLSNFLGSVYTTAKKTKPLFYTTLVGTILNIILNAIMIPTIGAIGAAIATLISYAVVWGIRVVNVRKYFDFPMCIKNNFASFAVLVVQIIVTYFEISYYWLFSGVAFCLLLAINKDLFITMFVLLKSGYKRLTKGSK